MAEKLIKQFTVGEDTGRVDYNALANLPEDKTDALRKLILKVAGSAEDTVIKDAIYSDYPRITLVLGEHVSLEKVLKGKLVEGVREMPKLSDNVYLSYDKDGKFYTNKDDKEYDSKRGGWKEIGQFNLVVKAADGYEITSETVSGSDAGAYNNIKLNDDGKYTPTDGETWIGVTQVKGNFTLTINASEKAPEPEPEETEETPAA